MSGLLVLQPGQIFAKDYRVVRPLSQGSMGAVYVVEQISTAAPRALKIIHPHLVLDPTLRARFEREAQVGAKIRSDHVVQVLAAGLDAATQMPWIIMELLEGESLAALAVRCGPLPSSYVNEVFTQLCHALSAAHRAGIVHRDLKPENIFIGLAQRAGALFTLKVLDFGIAKTIADAQTKMTDAIGTPLWMAPEQTVAGHAIKPSTDVWPLGLIAFYLLTGRIYWRGAATGANPMMLLREVAFEPLESAHARARDYGCADRLPPGFDAWFAQCVTRDLNARFSSAAEAQAALAGVLRAPAEPPTSSRSYAPAPASTPLANATPGAPPRPNASASSSQTDHGTAASQPLRAPPMDDAHSPRLGLLVAAFLGFMAVLLGAIGVIALRQPQERDSPALTEAAQSTAIPADPPASASAPQAPSPAAPATVATGAGTGEPAIAPSAPSPDPSSAPADAEHADVKPQSGPRAFNKTAAAAVLSGAAKNAKRCRTEDGLKGGGQARVTFNSNGGVIKVNLDPPFSGTPQGVCISRKFLAAHIPAFDGEPVLVVKSFSIE